MTEIYHSACVSHLLSLNIVSMVSSANARF
jgi:hypothetical protein